MPSRSNAASACLAVVLGASCAAGSSPDAGDAAGGELDAAVGPDAEADSGEGADDCYARAGLCDDHDPCTEAEYCSLGECVGGRAVTCDDGNECTADSCEPGTGECRRARIAGCIFLEYLPDPDAFAYLGWTVAIWEDTIVAGSRSTDPRYTATVSVWGRRQAGWTLEVTADNPSGPGPDHFGTVLATDGDRFAAGAEEAGDQVSGKVYVYERAAGAWSQTGEITGAPFERLGRSLAFANGYLLASAGTGGAVHVYEQSGADWNEVAEILAPDPDVDGIFGGRIAAAGETLAILDPYEGEPPVGAAYVTSGSGANWSDLTRLEPPGGAPLDAGYGESLAASESVVVVGAPWSDDGSGAAYVFELDAGEWRYADRLSGQDLAASSFGGAVAAGEDRIFVGTPYITDATVFVYARQDGAWAHWITLSCPDGFPVECQVFGSSLAWSGTDLAIGDPYAVVNGGLPDGAVFAGTVF